MESSRLYEHTVCTIVHIVHTDCTEYYRVLPPLTCTDCRVQYKDLYSTTVALASTVLYCGFGNEAQEVELIQKEDIKFALCRI